MGFGLLLESFLHSVAVDFHRLHMIWPLSYCVGAGMDRHAQGIAMVETQ